MGQALRRYPILLGLTLGVGLGLSLGAALMVHRWDTSRQQAEFQQQIENLTTALQRSLNRYTDVLTLKKQGSNDSCFRVEGRIYRTVAIAPVSPVAYLRGPGTSIVSRRATVSPVAMPDKNTPQIRYGVLARALGTQETSKFCRLAKLPSASGLCSPARGVCSRNAARGPSRAGFGFDYRLQQLGDGSANLLIG